MLISVHVLGLALSLSRERESYRHNSNLRFTSSLSLESNIQNNLVR